MWSLMRLSLGGGSFTWWDWHHQKPCLTHSGERQRWLVHSSLPSLTCPSHPRKMLPWFPLLLWVSVPSTFPLLIMPSHLLSIFLKSVKTLVCKVSLHSWRSSGFFPSVALPQSGDVSWEGRKFSPSTWIQNLSLPCAHTLIFSSRIQHLWWV